MVMIPRAYEGSKTSGYGQSEAGRKRKGSRLKKFSVSEIRPAFPQSKGAGGKRYSKITEWP